MNINRLEELKNEKNLKSKEVAKILGVSESTYSEWEHNKIPIPTRRLIQISDYYHINIDYLLRITDKRITINRETVIDLKSIGKRIKNIRSNMGLSLRELGIKINCSFSAFASYERGEKLINSDVLISLCKISNSSIDYILGRI